MQAKGREKDDELALFFDMRRRDKQNDESNNICILSSEQLDGHSLESRNNENLPISKCLSSLPLQRKSRDEFLNSENEKSDYNWLLTPPGTPLVSSEMESQRIEATQVEIPVSRPNALRSRPANIQVEPACKKTLATKTLGLPLDSYSNTIGIRRPSSAEGPKPATRRSSTPSARPTLPMASKPTRSSMPTSRSTIASAKVLPALPVRSLTPTRASARSSTPTGRPSVSVPAAKPATTTRQSSVTKSRPATSNGSVPSRGPSPAVKSRPWKPAEMPGFSVGALPNLKLERPASASRGRPVDPSIVKSSPPSLTTNGGGSHGRLRRQSCSPSRARTSDITMGSSFRSMTRLRCEEADEVSPVMMGTKMVERVVNMRKLVPPKREDYTKKSSAHNNSIGKSLPPCEALGFGRTLSKKSLDMAMRHMDIRQSMQGHNLRPLVTSTPASSMHSVRSVPAKNRAPSYSDSPCATSSDAGSEPSNNVFDGSDAEGSEQGR